MTVVFLYLYCIQFQFNKHNKTKIHKTYNLSMSTVTRIIILRLRVHQKPSYNKILIPKFGEICLFNSLFLIIFQYLIIITFH